MIEYCETFKMAFSKILDLMRRPKIVIESFFSYPILNFADTLTTVRRGKHWTFLLPEPTTATESIFFYFFKKKKSLTLLDWVPCDLFSLFYF